MEIVEEGEGEGAEVGGVAKELDEGVGGDGRVDDGELRVVRENTMRESCDCSKVERVNKVQQNL